MLDFKENNEAKINNEYKPPEKLQNDRKQVYLRYAYMRQARNPQEEIWRRAEKHYDSWRPARSEDDWQSNITPPFTPTIVERSLAEMIDQTMRPKVTARGQEDKPKAVVMNHTVDYTWEIGDGDLELYGSLKQNLVLGNTIWQEDYWRDRRIVKQLKKFNIETGEEEYVVKEMNDFDDVYGETVSLWDFFKDESARTINRGRYKCNDCIRRYIMPIETFRENFNGPIWNPFDAVKYVKAGGDLNYFQFFKPPEGMSENMVEVLFYWGRRPDKLIVVANDVVVRDGPNPFAHKQLPFAEGADVPRLDQFYAKGEPQLLESIQDELTTMRRMRVDRQHMDLWKMFLVSNREVLDEDEAIIAPSRFLHVDDPNNSIKALEYSDTKPSAYKEEELLKADGREITGMESPQPASTATGAAIYKEATMRVLKLKIWLLSRQLLTGIIRLRVPNITQYYSVPKVEKILGEKTVQKYRQITTTDIALELTKDGQVIKKPSKGENFFEVTPDLVTPTYGSFNYKMSAEPTFPLSKPLMQQKVNELMQHPVIIAAIQSGHLDVGKAADKMLEVNDFDPDDFKPEQSQQEQPIIDPQQVLELANRENELLVQGKRVPPTAYATREHTDIHLAFMSSPTFKEAFRKNQDIMQNIMYHALGEEMAQNQRGEQTQGQPQAQSQQMSAGQGIMKGEAKAAQPGRMMGSEMIPSGMPGQ